MSAVTVTVTVTVTVMRVMSAVGTAPGVNICTNQVLQLQRSDGTLPICTSAAITGHVTGLKFARVV